MPIAQRAKQFMPFAALTGLQEAFDAKEMEVEMTERRQLSSYQKQQINDVLVELKKGEHVVAEYDENGRNAIIKGNLKEIDEIRKTLTVGERRISFSDLYAISRA